MKKYLALILALCMVFALCACGSNAPAPAASPAADATDAPAAEESAAPETTGWAPDGPVTMGGCKMPKKYVAEMFCDRLAASKVYRGQDFQPGDPYQFFQYGKKKRLLMHPATSELLETILIVLRDQGEDAAFDYVRREVLGRK